ncbi:tRNA pseudouridine(38-40) synthase TruA [Parablautia intestinalis]|uniref:tRNA pseudouridine synthase A n=1 Tax=Parablautia intestinalis TaxID=2320100 RepID=A0A3A9AEX2_9FIRM|nr:tRNA pseudouridine(38-40) synthase TruA [Parablautia intestinalis]MCI8613736.1 tRNA pseudouridine(38-40) synthase TruA [Lachnospiraceae bacterium]RKI89937.1 tRNA pseudouridine(38-40) synthase TruA [Parablautia intestinalis]
MRNFKIVLQYEGTRYRGWQRQVSTENTIQGKLEALLTKMTGEKIEIIGSGRTDAGVHALGQVANFHADTQMSPEEILNYMNFYLPEDIAVISVKEVSERFHSRLNVKGKSYCYRVVQTEVPHIFDRKYAHFMKEDLDVAAMEKAAEILVGTHDFKAFTSSKKGKKSTVRTIEKIEIKKTVSASMRMQNVQDEIRFIYSGNGFLYHMVRIMTGTLLEVGTHKKRPEEVAEILDSGLREKAGELVPAKGLILMEVRYS